MWSLRENERTGKAQDRNFQQLADAEGERLGCGTHWGSAEAGRQDTAPGTRFLPMAANVRWDLLGGRREARQQTDTQAAG